MVLISCKEEQLHFFPTKLTHLMFKLLQLQINVAKIFIGQSEK